MAVWIMYHFYNINLNKRFMLCIISKKEEQSWSPTVYLLTTNK